MNPYLVYVENGYIRFSIGKQHFELHYDNADKYELEAMRKRLYKALSSLYDHLHKDGHSNVNLATSEPVAWGMEEDGEITDLISNGDRQGCMKRWMSNYPIPLYRHPPRSAVRLSDEEFIMESSRDTLCDWQYFELCRTIENAVLKKNGLEVKDEL